jgi:hypothetical protein
MLLINELKILYLQCSNSRKEDIILNTINDIKALTIMPGEDKNES